MIAEFRRDLKAQSRQNEFRWEHALTDQATSKHHVVIVGGGFAGLHAAKELGARWHSSDFHVTLIDKRNFHLFQPLLYQIATGSLSPGEIATPLRSIVRRYDNVDVLQATVESIDPDGKTVVLDSGKRLDYDSLIVGTGVKHQYFGNDQWRGYAPGLKTVEHALEMRRRIFGAFEQAELASDPELRKQLMTFVVVGAGPTGVELAGSIAELAHHTLVGDFANIDTREARIILIEGAGAVLPSYPEQLCAKAQKALEKLGVEVITHSFVTDIDDVSVTYQESGEDFHINASAVLWAAGVSASRFGQALAKATDSPVDRAGKLIVEADMSLPNYPDIYVAGDLSHFAHGDRPAVPGVAPAAAQQGKYVAKCLKKKAKGKDIKPFKYFDKGSMSVIGRNAAVAKIGKVKLDGFLAWWIWAFVHIFYLIEFDQKVLVMVRWAGKYFRRKRGVRLITGGDFNRAQRSANELADKLAEERRQIR